MVTSAVPGRRSGASGTVIALFGTKLYAVLSWPGTPSVTGPLMAPSCPLPLLSLAVVPVSSSRCQSPTTEEGGGGGGGVLSPPATSERSSTSKLSPATTPDGRRTIKAIESPLLSAVNVTWGRGAH